jgi:hypothetical protein
MEERRSYCFERGKTCLGRNIFLPQTAGQNWARKAISSLSAQLQWTLERQSYDERLLGEVIERLKLNLPNPIHYGENKPGWTFGDIPGDPKPGTLVVPDARFNYFDLFSFGISGEDGYEGFLRDCGLAPSTPYTHVVAATALLLLDEAIQTLDSENPWYPTWALYQAHDLLDELQSRESEKEVERRERKTFAIAGARMRHAETDEYKAEILKEWKTGRFKGNKSACAKWAIKQYPIKPSTVKRHLRAFEKGTLQAEC